MEQLHERPWHARTIDEVLQTLKVQTAEGLSIKEVDERRRQYGQNHLPEEPPTPWWVLLGRQFQSPLVYILIIAAVFTLWLQEWVDTTVIVLSVTVNTIIGFWQEYRANNLLEELKKVVHVKALVRRAGGTTEVDASELVPGDIIELQAGSKVPADARLLEVHQLSASEAILTGESTAVNKRIDPLGDDVDLADRKNMIWMGTAIEGGNGLAVVVATGETTQIGRIAKLSQQSDDGPTPLMERLARLANLISIIVGISAVVIFGVGLARGLSLVEVFTTAVAVAVSAIPEGLVAALSVVLAVSTSRILKNKGLVRRPVAAETLGSVTVICTDKTGTLTEGKMNVEKFFPEGPERDALLALVCANEARVEGDGRHAKVLGESTDRAKIEFALSEGVRMVEVAEDLKPVAMLSFDSSNKYIASFREDQGRLRCFVSGAGEKLLAMSEKLGGAATLTEADRTRLEKKMEELASTGYRVIAVAEREVREIVETDDDAKLREEVRDLTFLGIVAMRDSIRPDVRQTIQETRRAGVRVIMVTGDHRLTAQAIGAELGFRSAPENIADGAAIDAMDDETLKQKVKDIDIFVRVNPEHKLRIVKALKANGESVAMTGDGVNDAPALSSADIGVAVGSATDVTKEAADLVLLDDSFSTIVAAIREGRVAFDNIKKVTILLLSGSFTAFLLVMVSLLLGTPLPLSPVLILWANLVENGLPNFALAFEPAEADVMKRPPVARNAPVLDVTGKTIVFGIAVMRDIFLVGLFLWFLRNGYELALIQTIIFALLSTDSLAYIFSVKSFGQPIWKEDFFDNKFLLLSIGVGFVMVVAAVYLPFLNAFLGTVPLSVGEVGLVVGVALADIVLIEIVKVFYRRRIDKMVLLPV